jgi:hypothetical protein
LIDKKIRGYVFKFETIVILMKKRGVFNVVFLLLGLFLIFSLVSLASFVYAGQLFVTEEHPFLVYGSWISASQLVVGDVLSTVDGKKVRITSIQDVVSQDNFSVYNLEAGVYHNFIVGFDRVIVHNSNKPINPAVRCSGKCSKCGGIGFCDGPLRYPAEGEWFRLESIVRDLPEFSRLQIFPGTKIISPANFKKPIDFPKSLLGLFFDPEEYKVMGMYAGSYNLRTQTYHAIIPKMGHGLERETLSLINLNTGVNYKISDFVDLQFYLDKQASSFKNVLEIRAPLTSYDKTLGYTNTRNFWENANLFLRTDPMFVFKLIPSPHPRLFYYTFENGDVLNVVINPRDVPKELGIIPAEVLSAGNIPEDLFKLSKTGW